MSPELAARVESSVTGRRVKPGRSWGGPRLVAFVRAAFAIAALSFVVIVIVNKKRDATKLEQDRAALLATVTSLAASASDSDKGAVARDEALLVRLAGTYEGDYVSPDLAKPGALAAELSRPAVYVRGPIDGFSRAPLVAGTASSSVKDALLYCLYDAPSARTEKALLPKVRAAYSDLGNLEKKTPNVRRLFEAESGLPFFLPTWAARVREARDENELGALRVDLGKANVGRAKDALGAEVLIAVMDEAGFGVGTTEMDGERAHDVRIALVDLASGAPLLRIKRHVDPSGWSPVSRAEYATGLDGCAFAFDVAAEPSRVK